MASTGNEKIIEEIQQLRKSRRALILAHYYESPEIQDIADFIGDSLQLAQVGQKSDAPVILLAGVVFMAESVKMLSPEKTVLVPDLEASCSLVESSPYDKYLAWRLAHPNHIAVTYVNSSAAVKTISDVICTSSNAERVINSIPKDRPILFGPDKNLGRYLQMRTKREMLFWEGTCQVHILFNAKHLLELKEKHPHAVVIAHPECDDGVLAVSQVIGSTTRLLEEVKNNPAKEFIVATEDGILYQMRKSRPDANIMQAPIDEACACNECPFMKLNTLEKVRNALRDMKPEVTVSPKTAALAKVSLERMMCISEGQSVTWPPRFSAPQ